MVKLLAICLISFGYWTGGPVKPPRAATVAPKKPTASYRHYRGRNELRINKKTYRWYGPPEHGWLNNPYTRR